MKNFICLSNSELGICVVSPAATALFKRHHIRADTVFDAHRNGLPVPNLAAWEALKRTAKKGKHEPITNYFVVRRGLLDVFPDVEVCVETWLDRNTTILKLKSELV